MSQLLCAEAVSSNLNPVTDHQLASGSVERLPCSFRYSIAPQLCEDFEALFSCLVGNYLHIVGFYSKLVD